MSLPTCLPPHHIPLPAFPTSHSPVRTDGNSGEESVRAGVQQPRTTRPCTGDLTTCMPFTGPAHKHPFVLPENLVKFLWRIWLESVVLTVADNQTPRYPPPSPRVRAPGEGGVLHRRLPHPPQCETPGAEAEARVTEEELLRTQDGRAIPGPEGCEAL